MSGSLLDELAGATLRENSGSRAADRFDFQKDWALCLLLELHSTRNDYVVLFDYIDDIAVLNSATTPDEIEFYQIKTKRSGEFTLSNLLSRPKASKGFSILGKLVADKLQFPAKTKSLNLVSNVPFDFTLASNKSSKDMTQICFNALAVESIDKAVKQLTKEHTLEPFPDVKDITLFLVTDLSLLDHSTHAKGKLADFLNRIFPDKPLPVTAVYKTLFSEVARKNNRILSKSSQEGLLNQKAITKTDLSQMLESLPVGTEIRQRLLDVWNQLRHENVSYSDLEQLKGAVTRYELQKTNRANQLLSQITRETRCILACLRQGGPTYTSFCEKLNMVAKQVRSKVPQSVGVYSDQDIKGIIIFEDNNE